MNGCFRLIFLAMFSFVATTGLFARWTTQEDVVRAATATLAKPSFQTRFPNATIASVVNLGDLWCVNLAPRGHLIFAASTKQMPLLAYGFGTYVAPEAKSPEFTLQTGMSARAKQVESQTVSTFAVAPSPAEAAWAALLNPQPKVQLLAATEEDEEEEEELPSEVNLTSETWNPNWTQWEPWNDFCPQFGAEIESTNLYRNRAPVGCAATMYTQIMKFHEWPQRIDAIFRKTVPTTASVLKDENGNRINYDMRFHGWLPIEWNTLKDSYWKINIDNSTEREKLYTTEQDRFSVARLGFLIDVLSEMNFNDVEKDGSGTTLVKACHNDWYEFGSPDDKTATEEMSAPFTEAQLRAIKSSLSDGFPLPASIPGHAIFVCGYQEDDDGKTYLLLNYGWNNLKHENSDKEGSNRYYLAGTEEAGTDDATRLNAWLLGHMPKMQVQVAPLPKVMNVNVNELPSLMWMVPECHAADFKSFTVSVTPYPADKTITYNTIDKFTEATIDEEFFEIATLQDDDGSEVDALAIKPTVYEIETYTFPESFIPTEETTFFFNIDDMRKDTTEPFDTIVNIQLWNEIDIAWTTVASFPEKDETSEEYVLPEALEVSLAGFKDRFCKLRLTLSSTTGISDDEEEEDDDEEEETPSCYALTGFILSNIREPGESKSTKIKTAYTREVSLAGLMTEVGARYRVKVDATTAENEPVYFGETFTHLTDETIVKPIITSVTKIDGTELKDGWLLEGDLNGTSGLRVTCNEAVSELRVWSSCPTLIPDENITLTRQDDTNVFEVTLTPKWMLPELDGSRMILTLEARTAQGNVANLDRTIALRADVIQWDVDEKSINIPLYWFRKYGLVDDEITDEVLKALVATLAEEDADADGLLNWQEYLCNTSPIDATDKPRIKELVFKDDGTLEKVDYTPTTLAQGDVHLEGKTSLTDATWEEADLTKHRFFRLRVTTK